MTEIVYSTSATPAAAGRRYQNPRFFTGPLDGAQRVIIFGDWPSIAAAYQAAGVPVTLNGVDLPPIQAQASDFGPAAVKLAAELNEQGHAPSAGRRSRAVKPE